MTWLIVLAVLVVSAVVGMLMYRRRHSHSDLSGRQPLDVRDVQSRLDAEDLMRSTRNDWRR